MGGEEKQGEAAVGYVHTTNLPEFFQMNALTLVVSTYQAQRILCFNALTSNKLSMLMRTLERPTGLAIRENEMLVCSKNSLWRFATTRKLWDNEGKALPYDLTFVPRRSYVTGDVAAHQVSWHPKTDEVIMVNTRFSCLCTFDPAWSFVPFWKPPFITEFRPEDRCHLNGLCMDEDGPKYATALGESNTKEGWRENKASGGVLIDVPSGEIVCRGLSMPHSPFRFDGKLFVLESGKGLLVAVDEKTGSTVEVARFPGFTRGVAFWKDFAFVGLSKIREKKIFGGLPIEHLGEQIESAVYIVNLKSGKIEGFIRFTKGIEELFDLALLQGFHHAHIIGFEEDTIDSVMVLPQEFLSMS